MRTLTPAAVQAAAALTFDQQLALTGLAMDSRLDQAGLAFDVDTAHIEIPDLPEILTAPMPAAIPQPATVAEVFAEAARLITAHGWIRHYVGNTEIGFCLIGAIRKAASGNPRLEDAAEAGILQRIRRQFPDALSAGAWNAAQSGPAPVIRMLGH